MMGRLTLNVLLSFAQFERELSAERVRDKVAASRRKGKWTGGSVPLGYEAKDKKLVISKSEAETVRTIFRLYLELGSFGKLVGELDRRKIVTKRRKTKVAKYNGGIPFTYGPLAHFLKNRIYVGETHYAGKWFKGEHAAILDHPTFDRVQEMLRSNTVKRKVKFSESGAMLQGKLFDDKGNRMSPSFSSKNGVRYRFYVSTALRGRKQHAGSATRISAPEIEALVETSLSAKFEGTTEENLDRVDKIVLSNSKIQIELKQAKGKKVTIQIPWMPRPIGSAHVISSSGPEADPKLAKSIVRAHAWLHHLLAGRYKSVEDLAAEANIHPKVVRSFSRRHIRSPHRVAYYMFSGPDFPYVDAIFPDAAVYILSGLEPVGKPAGLKELGQSGLTLRQLLASLNTYFRVGFFKTEEMRAKQDFAGLTPLLMALIARSGNSVKTVELFHLEEDGNLTFDNDASDQPDGLKVVFVNSRAQIKQLYYFGVDLSNDSRKLDAVLRFCRDTGDGDSLLKSASYLLHREEFSKVREFLLDHSSILVEDDSGVPVRYLSRADWALSLFGSYQAPLGKFETYYQPELASMHQQAKYKSYTFGMGYLGQIGGSHLLLARRRSSS